MLGEKSSYYFGLSVYRHVLACWQCHPTLSGLFVMSTFAPPSCEDSKSHGRITRGQVSRTNSYKFLILVQPDVIAHVITEAAATSQQNLPPSGCQCSSSSLLAEESEEDSPSPSLSSFCSVFCFFDSVGWISLSCGAGTSPAKLVSLRNFRPQSREPEQTSETIRKAMSSRMSCRCFVLIAEVL